MTFKFHVREYLQLAHVMRYPDESLCIFYHAELNAQTKVLVCVLEDPSAIPTPDMEPLLMEKELSRS